MITIKENIYKARANVVKALAHKTRLQIVDILVKDREHCVCELTDILGVSQSSVSKHLGILKKAGIVDSKKDGLNVSYFLRTPCVKTFFECIDQMIQEDLKIKVQALEIMRRRFYFFYNISGVLM